MSKLNFGQSFEGFSTLDLSVILYLNIPLIFQKCHVIISFLTYLDWKTTLKIKLHNCIFDFSKFENRKLLFNFGSFCINSGYLFSSMYKTFVLMHQTTIFKANNILKKLSFIPKVELKIKQLLIKILLLNLFLENIDMTL